MIVNRSVEDLAARIVSAFTVLDVFEQRLSLELYRLLSGVQPVARGALAPRLHVSVETVDRILDDWPGVFSDSERRLTSHQPGH